MLRCYERAHIVGISKTAYVPATPRCLDWRHDLQRTSTNHDPSDSDPLGPGRRPARSSSRRSPQSSATGSPASSSSMAARPRPHRPSTSFAVSILVRSARPTVPSPTARRSSTTRSRASPSSTQLSSVPCAAPRPTPRTTGSSSSSTAAGVPRRTRNSSSMRRSPKYGSEAEAARWVATPDTSAHVSGDAVDIGPSAAAAWLSEHGAAYGLCQIYGNEPWHYELRPDAASITAARPCTPTRRTIQGCSGDHETNTTDRWPSSPCSP